MKPKKSFINGRKIEDKDLLVTTVTYRGEGWRCRWNVREKIQVLGRSV